MIPAWWPSDKPWIIDDCINIMKNIPDKCIDLTLTDPPYGLGFDYGDTYIDTKENLIELIGVVMPEIIRISKLSAIMCGITPTHLYPHPDWIMACVWDTTGSHGYFGYTQWFPVLMYGKDIKGFGSVNGVLKSDVIHITGGGGVGFMRDKNEKEHPVPKPMTIIEKLVRRLSNENDIIFEPFLGGGSIMQASRKNNRTCIGCEINPKYEQIIRKRSMADQPEIERWF